MEISRTALRKLMLLITFAILLYTGLQHLSQVLGFSGLWGALSRRFSLAERRPLC